MTKYEMVGNVAPLKGGGMVMDTGTRKDMLQSLKFQVDYCKAHGFKPRNVTLAGTVRRFEIVNPYSRNVDAVYFVRQAVSI